MTSSFVKDPDAVDVFGVRWCSKNNTNDGASVADTGKLQGATISSYDWIVPTGITEDSESVAEFSAQGITYVINTVHRITLSGGTTGEDYDVVSRIVTSDGRTLDKTITIECRST